MTDLIAIFINISVYAIAIIYANYLLAKTPQEKHKNSIIVSLILSNLFFIIYLFVFDTLIRKTLFISSITAGLISITFYFSRFIAKSKKNYLDFSKLVFYSLLLPSVFFKFNHFPYSDLISSVCLISSIPILAKKFKKLLTQG